MPTGQKHKTRKKPNLSNTGVKKVNTNPLGQNIKATTRAQEICIPRNFEKAGGAHRKRISASLSGIFTFLEIKNSSMCNTHSKT